MSRRFRENRKPRYGEDYRPVGNEKPLIGQICEVNPEIVKGYIVVAILIDDSQVIAHNSCCMPHILNSVTRNMIQNEELMRPHRDYATGHGS